jgi:hypothetical protein
MSDGHGLRRVDTASSMSALVDCLHGPIRCPTCIAAACTVGG